ncbi:hypothetical protein GPJ59_28540 [Streptomyces bambusae]|uniref:Transposase n=1 Tax=Streptomyces bambusae TaxID=1550616 RepID=A0ABS6ZD76_9ACTN|nr:hypothetical protein [Streptomyces bambusae]
MRLARLAHGVDELSQEKPSGRSMDGQIHPIVPAAHPGAKTRMVSAPDQRRNREPGAGTVAIRSPWVVSGSRRGGPASRC